MAIDRTKITKLAENYMAMGKVERAIDEFLKLIEDRPDDFQLLNRVGDAYLQAGKVPEAVELFKRAGSGFERGGFNSKATAVFKKAHRIVTEDLDIAERLAELYRQMNLIKDAIQIHIEVAELFTKKGLIKRALEEFAKVVDLDPKNLKNKVKLADLYNKEGMKDRAANIYLEVAEALAMEQMHSEANQILERAKTMVSTPQVFLTQSRLCVIQKDLPAAITHLREGLGANPRSPELLDALAEVELQARCPERALEALQQVPQLPEKSLLLCERALREMVRGGHLEEALRLFKPIGREFARRGLGEAAAKALRTGLQGSLTLEAWLQLAEIAHQSGNRPEHVDCLRHAYTQAETEGDAGQAATLAQQLQGLGVALDQLSAPFAAGAARQPQQPETLEPLPASEHTEVDPVRRMQIEQLQRDGEHSMRNRFMDRALESFNKVLELEPANARAIQLIADIHRASGVLTKVQMHYVKTAEKIAALGFRAEAVELLDRAEAMFPGSTRLYRRNLGLMDIPPAVPPPVAAPAIALPAPVEAMPIIELDDNPRGPRAFAPAPDPFSPVAPVSGLEAPFAPVPEGLRAAEPAAPALDMPSSFHGVQPSPEEIFQLPIDHLEALDAPIPADYNIPAWETLQEEALAPAVPEPVNEPVDEPVYEPVQEYEWSEITGGVVAPEPEPAADFVPLELEPLPFATGPQAPAEVDENLEATLSDIDFQMDYGSPEEAKLEIVAALKLYPQHPELNKRLALAEDAMRRLGFVAAPKAMEEADFAQSFFDLTDVLGDALLESGDGEEMHDATNVVEKIQSVDELFNAFREGVEQQVKGDDYDTHYNLGIAYKEMLLLEPAIEEFKKAMLDPERTLECCSMLAICEQAQGNLDEAIQWLNQGIQAPGFPPEDAIGLRYDLGLILALKGQHPEAQEQFRLVQALDPEYRELAQQLDHK